MKVVLSRKGFDSGAGGHPSPVLPDGTLLSLPIPDTADGSDVKYKDLHYRDGTSYLEIMHELGIAKYDESSYCHLDPDIFEFAYEHQPGWHGAFGQTNAAQSHLTSQNIKETDLFLFFGYFQDTRKNSKGHLEFIPGSQKHIIYGYLQIGQIFKVCEQLRLDDDTPPDWLKYHPHCSNSRKKRITNTIYTAKEKATWDQELQGFGTFEYSKELVLTKSSETRSRWKLPEFFKEVEISYHDKSSWRRDYFQSASRGQEFVIEENSQITEWAKSIVSAGLDKNTKY